MTDYFRAAEVCVVVSEMVRRQLSHRLDHLGADVLNPLRKVPWDCVPARSSDEEYRRMQIAQQQGSGIAWEQLECFHKDEYEAMAGPNWRDYAGYSEEERRYRARWGLLDEIAGWLVGFHESRVWTFQETLLAQDVIHVGGNLRINTPAVLVMEYYWSEYEHVEARTFPVEWLPTPYKFERLQYLRSLYLESLHVRFPLPSRDYLHREHQRYTRPGDALEDAEWSLNQCLSIVQEQQREAKFEQDKIYGILGLFPPRVRFALPARYDISLSAVFAILTYLRICHRDLYAFFFAEDRSAPEHGIVDAPSWIPRRHGQMQILQSKPSQSPLPQDDPFTPAWPDDMMHVEGRKLIITAPYLEIAECADLGTPIELTDPMEGVLHGCIADHSFWLLPQVPEDQELSGADRPEQLAVFRKERSNVVIIDSLEEALSGAFLDKLDKIGKPEVGFRQSKPCIARVNLMEPQLRKVTAMSEDGQPQEMGVWSHEHYEEIRQNRKTIAEAVAVGKAVMVNFGYTSGGTELWLVLITTDDGETWRKVGNLVVENKMVQGYEKFGMTMEPWQKTNRFARTFVVL